MTNFSALLLGSSASLSDCFTPPLRQSPPHKPSDPLLQELSDVQVIYLLVIYLLVV